MSGLSLLLELLELLRGDEADGFVPGDQLGASRHGGQDDVPAQTADAARTRRGGRGEGWRAANTEEKILPFRGRSV